MWTTLELLASVPVPRGGREKVNEWLEDTVRRIAAASRNQTPPPRSNTRSKTSLSQSRVQPRVEHFLGASAMRMTDRQYMQRMQKRILEEHRETLRRRIQNREAEEAERQKKLVLDGLVLPSDQDDHPVFNITRLTNFLIEERRIKDQEARQRFAVKAQQRSRRRRQRAAAAASREDAGACADDPASWLSPDSALGLTGQPQLGTAGFDRWPRPRRRHNLDDDNWQDAFTQVDYDRIKYEDPRVKRVRDAKTLAEMYALADEIIGPLKTRVATKAGVGGGKA